jgi:hypothetical protein
MITSHSVRRTALIAALLAAPGLHAAEVAGSWPVGTEFEWTIECDFDATIVTRFNALLVSGNANTGSGYLSASVTATTRGGETETVGPITLTVTFSGCC